MAHTDDVCQYHSGIESDIQAMQESIKTIETKLDRPPVWMTFVFSGMTFILGCALTWMVHLHSMLK